ncbi:MAG: type I methionyl aminopeptidase [Spirochaetaceae bacterium]|nr:type I methionyl aminopeptidase [Spirochaetaceae bacterium]
MISIKNSMQQDGIRRSADLLSAAFSRISTLIKPGVTTLEIDRVVEETIRAGGGIPAFLGYGGFPASVCTSVNDQVIHGIPNDNILREGDIVGCDIGVILNGYFSDSAKTFAVGDIDSVSKRLLDATEQSLMAAIAVCKPGNRVKDIGKAVTESVKPYGFGVVYSYCGHGVGLSLHEDPQIPNYYPSRGTNPRLKAGMVIAIEPMINAGTADVEVLDDDWTVITADGSLSAHFEHSILITGNGADVLTSWGA